MLPCRLASLGALLLAASFLSPDTHAQTFCLVDLDGDTWELELSDDFFTGTVEVAGAMAGTWLATGGRGTINRERRHHTFVTINPLLNEDPGCRDGPGELDYVDWFTMNGRITPVGGGDYTFSGTYLTSCGGTGAAPATITTGTCPAPRAPRTRRGSKTSAAAAVAPTLGLPLGLRSSPNPFAEGTLISFELAERSAVRLAVFDALGREVAVLVDEVRGAGQHTVALDAAGLATGVYVLQLVAGDHIAADRVTLTR